MTVTYTTVAKVVSQLRLYDPIAKTRRALGTLTDPQVNEVETWINEAEDEIDNDTHHAWRAKLETDEYHDVDPLASGYYRREIPIHLKHRIIRPFVSGTHKIEVWQGNVWKDMVLASNGFIEGRDKDYWIDYTNGVVYLITQKPSYGTMYWESSVRVTYAWGESTVPGDIQRACTLLAAIVALENDDYKVIIPEGLGNSYQLSTKAETWRKKAESILASRTEFITAV